MQVTPVADYKVEVYLYSFFNPGSRKVRVVNATSLPNHCTGRWVGPQGWSGKISKLLNILFFIPALLVEATATNNVPLFS